VDDAVHRDMRHQRALIAALGVAVTLGAASAARSHDPGTRLLFTGDILLSRQVQAEISRTGRSPFESVAPLFANADWISGNLEGALGDSTECRVAANALCFASIDTAATLFARAGFDALTLENNHAGDLGEAGRTRTRAALRAASIVDVEFERSPRFARVGARTMAVVSVTTIPSADGHVQHIPSVDLEQKLRLARALASIVVVSVHWGNELQDWPSAAQRDAAKWLVSHGANLVVGHHPHVVQDPDCVDGVPVFYSLGNHVFDQKYPQTKEGLIADCLVEGERLRCGGIRTHTRVGSAVPVPDESRPIARLVSCAPKLETPPAFAAFAIRPEPSSGDSGVVLEGWRDGRVQWRTRPVRLVTMERGIVSESGTPLLFTLERHPSDFDGEVALRPHVYEITDRGFVAKWRGTSLAWPLIDATVNARGEVCAIHRGDSFMRPDPRAAAARTMRYRWNGFGFSGIGVAGEAGCSA
jgi:poly-gamma-glutamate synthesis protein (capsule biosynthesis protein)